MAGEFISDEEMEKLEGGRVNPTNARAAAKTEMDLLKKFKDLGYKTATPEFFKDILNFGTGFLDQTSLENLRYSPAFQQALDEAKTESPRSTMTGQGAGLAGVTAASMALPALSAAKALRIGPLVTGAIQGAATKPEGSEGLDLKSRAKQAAIAPVVTGAVRGLGAGAMKVGDRTMQMATGSRDYVKGLGTRMADEGLIGTKGMMKGQIAKKLPKREADLTAATRQVTGAVRPGSVGRAVRAEADPYIPQSPVGRSIPIPSENQPFVDLAEARALEVMSRGSLNPQEAISSARAVAKPAYNKAGAPLDAFKHKLSQTEAIALKDAVKELADKQGIPGVRKALSSEQALIAARTGLTRPEPMNEAIIRGLTRGTVGAGVGFAGGVPGMLAGAAATTPAGLSVIGQAATKAGRKIPLAAPASVAGAANLVGGSKPRSNFISDEEMEAIESGGNASDRRAKRAAGDKEGSARFLGIKKKDLEAIEKIPMPAKQRSGRSAR